MTNDEAADPRVLRRSSFGDSPLIRHSGFVIRHSTRSTMLTTTFQPRKPFRHRAREHASTAEATPPPVALTLGGATYDTDDFSVVLTFDRAVDASGLNAAAVTLEDGEFAAGSFVGSGPATVIGPTTIRVFLEEIGGPSVPDVELTATAMTGIVAVDDGGTWEGVTGLVLPFP
jgi:hypothetical protein